MAAPPKTMLKNYVTALLAKSEASDAHDFWSSMFCAQLTFEDIAEVLSFATLRQMRQKQPKSLAMLIIKSIEQAHLFAKYTGTYFVPMLNAMRILTRVMPVVFEDPVFTENLFWKNKIRDQTGKEVIYDYVGTEKLTGSLGQVMMTSLLAAGVHGRFTFLPSDSVMSFPEALPAHKLLNPRYLWKGGVGIPDNGGSRDAATDANRIDLLRCLLACLSGPLFRSKALDSNKFADAMLGTPNSMNVTFAYSLINTIFAYDPAGALPFTSYWTDTEEVIVDMSIQVLLAGMDYNSIITTKDRNAFWYAVQALQQPYDLLFVVNGIKNLLGNRINANNTWIPGSQKELNCHGALLLLAVKMVQENPRVTNGLLRVVEITELMSMLLFIIYEDTINKRGIIKPAICLLLQLSQDDSFCRVLNTPFSGKLPANLPPVEGNHVDLLVVVLHHIMNINQDWLKPLFEQLWTILYNVSPHAPLRSVASAARVVNLLNIFSNPKILSAEPDHATSCVQAMEVICNFLSYDIGNNITLLYVLLRDHAVFQRVSDMMQAPTDSDDSEDDELVYFTPETAAQIPIELPMKLIASLAPKLNEFCYGGKQRTEGEILEFLARVRINNMPEIQPFEPREYNSFDRVSDLIVRWTWNSIFVSHMTPPVWDANSIRLFQLTKIGSLEAPQEGQSTALVVGGSNAVAIAKQQNQLQLAPIPPPQDGQPVSILRYAIMKLIQVPVAETEENFWRVVFLPGGAAVSFEEVCSAISIGEGRELRFKQPLSLANLILKCIQRLELCALNPSINEYTAVTNILRILTRLLPLAFETELPSNMQLAPQTVVDKQFATSLFWKAKVRDTNGAVFDVSSSDGQLWGGKLMDTLAALACRPGLTFIPSSSSATLGNEVLGHPGLNPRILWAGGIGVAQSDLGNTRDDAVNQTTIAVLRCILACFTETLYATNPLEGNKFVKAFTNRGHPYNITLCYSLLNTAIGYDPSGSLPYTSYWTDSTEEVIAYSLQVLLATLNYGFFQGNNCWWSVVENLKSKRDLAYLSAGVLRLLSNRYKAANTWLPMSQKEVDFHAPLLLLLLKLVQKNPDLRNVMALAVDMDELMASLLFIMYDDTVHKRGLLKPATCILLYLSQDPVFCSWLSKPFNGNLPANLPKFSGNIIDLLVIVLNHIMNLNEEWIKPIYDQFWAILYNVSPHCVLSSVVGSAKLVALLDMFSGPKVLAKSPEFTSCVVHGVEVINNFMCFNYAHNRTLLYIILREKAVFDRVEALMKPGATLHRQAKDIPMEMIRRLLNTLVPRLEEYCRQTGTTSDSDVMNFLARIQLTNMPVAKPVKPRHATRVEAAVTQWVWATIFGRNVHPQLWAVGPIKLITVPTPQRTLAGQTGVPAAALLLTGKANTKIRRAFDILSAQVVDVNDAEFWRSLFTTPFTFEELTSSVPLSIIRNLKNAQPVSFATLVYKSVEQAHLFGKYSGDFYIPVCNALRLLTRVMPIVYEREPGQPDFGDNLLWKNTVIGLDGLEVGVQTKNWCEDEPGPEKSLGQILANSLLHAALHPGFAFIPTATTHTLPEKTHEKSFSNPRHIWCGGLGLPDTGNQRDATVDAQRIDLLQCIVSCTSGVLYQTDPLVTNKFIRAMVGELHMFNVTFAYSLLNLIFAYDPQGSGPYMSYWTDTQEVVVDKALQVLLALLHPGKSGSTNAFWYVLTKIQSDRDMAVAVQGCLNFLNNRRNAANTWIPGSQKDLDLQGLTTVLVIKLLQANPMLRDKLCKVVAIKDIVASILFIIIEDFQQKRGYMGAATLLLFMLSEEPNFGRVLTLPAEKLPTAMPLPGGSWFDLLIMLTHHMASSEVEWIHKLTHRMLATIYHASPCCVAISADSSVRLIQLFGVYSRQLLGGDRASAVQVGCILKIISNLLTFNFTGNCQMVVSLLFTSNIVERLENLAMGTGDGASVPADLRAKLSTQASVPIRVLKSLDPLYKQHCQAEGKPDRDTFTATLLRVNLSGMPEPPQMVIESPESAEEKDRRITKFAWYCIFTHNLAPAIWPPSAIKIITVQAQEA